jgi:hypothetical protein
MRSQRRRVRRRHILGTVGEVIVSEKFALAGGQNNESRLSCKSVIKKSV